MNKSIGKIVAIAIRTEKNGPMREIESVRVKADGGLDGDVTASADRGVTMISQKQWREVIGELGADLPWHTRRANLLIDAGPLGEWIGKRLRIGDIEVDITQEVKPCGLMDELHDGLRDTLKPDGRGGIGGRIIKDGSIRVGDLVVQA